MGIFGESAWALFEMINKRPNGLTAYYTNVSGWHLVITRENPDLKHLPIRIEIPKGNNTFSIETPPERIWENLQNKPIHAVYLVPWNIHDEYDPSYGMIQMVDNELGKRMHRIFNIGNEYYKLHAFLSRFQYPYLEEIKNIADSFLFLHQTRFKNRHMKEQILMKALCPSKLKYYLSLGYTIDDWCNEL